MLRLYNYYPKIYADTSSAFIAPRQLLLRCPTTVHPWTYALSYYRPSMDMCVTLVRPPRMVEVQILHRYMDVTY